MTVNHFEKSLMLTSELPTSLTYKSTDKTVHVQVSAAGTVIFATTLYPYNGQGSFSGLQEIIEAYMEQHHKVMVTISIMMDDSDSEEDIDFNAIYCRHRLASSTLDFCLTHYLTLADAFLIPRGTKFIVPFYLESGTSSDCHLDVVVQRKDGTIAPTLSYMQDDSNDEGECISYEYLYEDDIAEATRSLFPSVPFEKILSVTARRGARSITLYYTDTAPALHLHFRNAFNAQMHLYLFGTLTTNTDMEQTEATCQGQASFYDRSLNQTFDFETSFLTPDEAIYLTQLLISPQVYLMTAPKNLTNPEILITDMTAETTDNSTDTNRIKFTFKYRHPTQLHYPTESKDIFTTPYNPTFQ